MRTALSMMLITLPLQLGCTRLETARECETVIALINEQLSAINELARGSSTFEVAENDYKPLPTPPAEEKTGEKGQDGNAGAEGDSPPDAKDLADRYEKLAANLKAQELKSGSLKRVVQNYSSMLLSASRALSKLSARQAEQPSKANRIAFDNIIKQERSLVQQLDRVCHPH